MYSVQELAHTLRRCHARVDAAADAALLAAICLGLPVAEIALIAGCSQKTIYRRLHLTAERALDPTGYRPSRDLLRTWAELHADCCARQAFRLIRDDAVAEKLSHLRRA